MDASALDALAMAAGNAFVAAASKDMWQEIRHKIANLFDRGHRDPRIETRLDSTRSQLTETAGTGLEEVRVQHVARWSARVADLLSDYPEAEVEVRDLIQEIRAMLPISQTTALGAGSVAIAGDASPSASTGGIAASVLQGPAIVVNPPRPDPPLH